MDRILIIGGTNFIGRNLINKLSLNKKYDLTIFNRGITNPDLFPNIKKIIGDRNSPDVKLIHQINWDYIIDLSCYFPQSLINILSELPLNLKKYIFSFTQPWSSIGDKLNRGKRPIQSRHIALDAPAALRPVGHSLLRDAAVPHSLREV